MYDNRLQDVKKTAETYGFTVLIPASNMIIVKELAENPSIAREIENHVGEVQGLDLTWTENTAEIRVKDQ